MPRVRKDSDPEVPFFHIQIVDAEGGRVRFGPFTSQEFRDSLVGALGKMREATPEVMAEDIGHQVQTLGLVTALTSLGIWGGLTVSLKGDDGTDLPVWDYPPPGIDG